MAGGTFGASVRMAFSSPMILSAAFSSRLAHHAGDAFFAAFAIDAALVARCLAAEGRALRCACVAEAQ
jgi:hypothetical protein